MSTEENKALIRRFYEEVFNEKARHELGITVQIVHRPEGQRGFTVLPRRWVVERTNAWIRTIK